MLPAGKPSRLPPESPADATQGDGLRSLRFALEMNAPAHGSRTLAPHVLRVLASLTLHRNSRVCRRDAGRVQMAWRSTIFRADGRGVAVLGDRGGQYLTGHA